MAIPTPVSFWNADESSGNMADAVGSNTLTNNNTATFTTGLIGNAADLERGSSQYFSIADASQTGLDFTGNFSLALWTRFESVLGASTETAIMGKWGTGQRSYLMSLDTFGGTFIDCSISSTGSDADTRQWTWNPTTATWYHVVWTFNDSSKLNRVYIDGSSLGDRTSTLTPFNGSGEFQLGYRGEGSINYADGLQDMIGAWNVELTEAQVLELYNGGAGIQYPFGGAVASPKLLNLMGVGA